MKAFIDEHRDAYGVEWIRKVLLIAPSTYNPARRTADQPGQGAGIYPAASTGCATRTAKSNGACKAWRQLRRETITVARCTVERLKHQQGLRGVKTTVDDKALSFPQGQGKPPLPGRPSERLVGIGLCQLVRSSLVSFRDRSEVGSQAASQVRKARVKRSESNKNLQLRPREVIHSDDEIAGALM